VWFILGLFGIQNQILVFFKPSSPSSPTPPSYATPVSSPVGSPVSAPVGSPVGSPVGLSPEGTGTAQILGVFLE